MYLERPWVHRVFGTVITEDTLGIETARASSSPQSDAEFFVPTHRGLLFRHRNSFALQFNSI